MIWMYLIGEYCIVGLVVTFAVKTNQRQKPTSSLEKNPSLAATLLIGTACWPLVAAFSLSDWRRLRRERQTEKNGSENRRTWLRLLQSAERSVKNNQTTFRASEAHTIIHGLREAALQEAHWQETAFFRANGSVLGYLSEFFKSGVHPKTKVEEFYKWEQEFRDQHKDFHGTFVKRPVGFHIRLLDSFFDSVQLANADEQRRILESLPLLNVEFERHGIDALKDSGTGGLAIKHLASDSYVFVPHVDSTFTNLLCWCPDRQAIF